MDGIFPVLSPIAQNILELVQFESDSAKICKCFDNLPPTHGLWDDLINVAVQLRINKQWGPVISVSFVVGFHFC